MVSASTTITFYDFLNKIVIGFLLLCILMQYLWDEFLSKIANEVIPQQFRSDENLKLFICFIASFILGLVFSYIVDWITSPLRNRDDMISKAKENVEEESIEKKKEKSSNDTGKKDSKSLKHDYYICYYKLMKEGMLNNIPLLEAMEKFVRLLFFLCIVFICLKSYHSYFSTCDFIKNTCTVFILIIFIFVTAGIIIFDHLKCENMPSILLIISIASYIIAFCVLFDKYAENVLTSLLFMLLLYFIWRKIQMKIYKLVWEGDAYISIMP